jgi:hypothetical protein
VGLYYLANFDNAMPSARELACRQTTGGAQRLHIGRVLRKRCNIEARLN